MLTLEPSSQLRKCPVQPGPPGPTAEAPYGRTPSARTASGYEADDQIVLPRRSRDRTPTVENMPTRPFAMTKPLFRAAWTAATTLPRFPRSNDFRLRWVPSGPPESPLDPSRALFPRKTEQKSRKVAVMPLPTPLRKTHGRPTPVL